MTPLRHVVIAAAFAGIATSASAQDFKQPVKIVVPFAAGGATDQLARLLAPRLAKQLGTPIQVENRAGASGQVGTAAVKSAAADGATLLLAPDHAVVVVPLISPTAGYDAIKDFVPLGQVARYQWALSVPASSPARNLAGYVDLLRARPQDANYGIPLKGGVPEIIGTVIERKAGVPLQATPYSGSSAVLPPLVAGEISAGVTGEPEALTLSREGKVRIIAVSGGARSPVLPDVPTFEEAGFPGVNVNSFHAFYAPKGLPQPMAQAFNAALRNVLKDDEVKRKIKDMPLLLDPTDLEGARRELAASQAFWEKATKAKK
ncbi:MFS transporter [Pigmentiphaga litoralis]|uniref:Bug family tripartite tricarboxylate transporter substrate binding protein n=1 Tax=Pigmentiphaga litoralis TaxID=516702 RepID=UPI00167A0F77|nr:tripartite tricarboxylate transporter substrate-binding protein [Pigmentiphaga litoralis]GGX10682.1 MFS transporter [Pigmentiphaga litoralis]